MKRHLLMITTAASILVCGTVAGSTQDEPDNSNMQQLEQAQQDPVDQDAGPDTDGTEGCGIACGNA